MKSNFNEYLENGTKKIIDMTSSENLDEEERCELINALTEELSKNIFNTDKFQDYERLLSTVSVRYLDRRISAVIQSDNSNNDDCNKTIEKCQRQQELLREFRSRNWTIPMLANNDLDACIEVCIRRKNGLSISDKIYTEDRQLDALISKARSEFSIDACNEAMNVLAMLETDIQNIQATGVKCPNIQYRNTAQTRSVIIGIKNNIEQRNSLHAECYNIDNQIHVLVCQPGILESTWLEIIELSKRQRQLLNECTNRDWTQPSLKYYKPDELVNKYKHYVETAKLDKVLTNTKDTLRSRSDYETFYKNCDKQTANVVLCKKNGWLIPDINIKDPYGLAETIRKRKAASDTRRRILTVGVIAAIVVLVTVFSVMKSRQGKIQIPVAADSVSEIESDKLSDMLKEAGFKDVSKKESDSGWEKDGKVIGITVDDSSEFHEGAYFYPDAKIVIECSSKGRKDVSKIVKNWENKDYVSLKNDLMVAGFNNITELQEDTFDVEKNLMMSGLSLNGYVYKNGECYLPPKAPINLSYYILKIKMESKSSKMIGENYHDVTSNLESLGFTNIEWRRANNLQIGLLKKEGDIASISIDGYSEFSKGDVFSYDAPIVMVVNTFPDSGCDDIIIID